MVLVKILFQILKGSLFTNEKDCEFTIFNTCIIDLMPSIIALIQSVRKTKLPSVIEKLMQSKGRVDRDVNYNYLTENHNENIEHSGVPKHTANSSGGRAYIPCPFRTAKPKLHSPTNIFYYIPFDFASVFLHFVKK